ncbi:hypothetical protein IC575_004256 [Cucumis melo]
MGSSSVGGAESSSSCSSNLRWSYDVFLSFRGEDTRDKFISHLVVALRQKGVDFFIDDKLDRGHQISKSLLKSIEESRISIIIFSQNYASSTWCLDELVKIIERMRSKKQRVLPVFYNVCPTEVVKQTGSFGEAMAKYETNRLMINKIQPWKEALTTAATLSGWDLPNYWKNEAHLIHDLVEKVSVLKQTQLLNVAKHPVGIDSQLKAVEEFASHGVLDNGVNMVGIHGMGGIGKTTLAKALYNKITYEFEACCFLSNVREASEQFNGLVQLQEKLLSEIFKDNNLKVDNVHRGMNIMKDRLCSRKVLIVLDDVDKDDQLDALVGGRDWFGRGSKIIVTTRDRHLLERYSFDKIHPIQLLDYVKSLELFCWHAFKQNHPSRDYLDLSELVVRYCNGLPLALVILGSLLCKRDQIIWKSKLDELKNFPEPGIEAVFQISFKRLEENPPVKEIFLDICCFFVGEDVSYSKNVLKACDPYLESRIIILMDLSLVTVEDGKIQMHDLIRQMGQTIVRRKSSKPEKRSRLWVAKEAVKMLIEKSGTHKVKAIKLDLRSNRPLIVEAEAFRNMENLRLLIFQNAAKFPTNIFKYLPNIKWIEYSSSNVQWYFPISFVVNGGLVGLVINGVSNKHPGIIFEDCKMLKHVDLSYWRLLEETPDFSVALNLEKLYLRSCKRLEMIHGSIASLSKLVTLDLEGCENLEKLPSSFLMLKSLEVLNLSGCIKLKEIPDLSASSSLKELHLRECYNLRIIHDSVGRFLDKLVILDFEGCRNLERLPRYIRKSGSIEVLNLDSCRKIEQIFDNYFEKFPSHLKYESLKVLNLSYCQNLKGITDFSFASNLEILDLRGCFSLRTIHESVGSLDKLIALKLDSCHLLEELPSCLRLKSLDSLSLTNCYKLEQLPEFDENMKSLREMNLKGTAIRKLPSSIRYLIGLENLNLSYCTNLISLPSEIHLLKSLKELDLHECSRLDMFPSGSSLNFPQQSLFSNLTILDLQNCNISNTDFLENLSNFCTTLKELNLSGNKFCSLPSLQNFSSLRHLELRNCKFLRNIVKIPHCLTRVDASGCELFVISPDYIADIMFRNQDLELRNFKRELIVAYSKIPKFCNNQTTESSTSFSFQQNSDTIIPALVVCVVFKVDEDSCDAEGFIRFQVLIDGYDAYYGRLVWVKIRAYVVTKNSSITIDILERE